MSKESQRAELSDHLERAKRGLCGALRVCAAMQEDSAPDSRIERMIRAVEFAALMVGDAIRLLESDPAPQGRYNP